MPEPTPTEEAEPSIACLRCGLTIWLPAPIEEPPFAADAAPDLTELWTALDAIPYWLAYTTTNDCHGHPEIDEASPFGWCLYDADEDDPPLAEGLTRDDAERIVNLWAEVRRLRAAHHPGGE